MRGLVTDHVISGPMRGLTKNCIRWRKQTDKQTDRHGDSMTESAQWADSMKIWHIRDTKSVPTKFSQVSTKKQKGSRR